MVLLEHLHVIKSACSCGDLSSTVTPPGGVTTILGGGHLLVVTSPKISGGGGVTGDLPQNLVWGGSPKFGDLPQKSGWGGGHHLAVTSPKSTLGGHHSLVLGNTGHGGTWVFPTKSPIFLRSRLRRSRNPCHSLVGKRTKNEPFVRKRSWRILSVKGRASVKLALSVSQNVRILTSICTVERHSPRSTKLSPAAQKWRVSILHTSKSDGRLKIFMRKLATLLSEPLMDLEYL